MWNGLVFKELYYCDLIPWFHNLSWPCSLNQFIRSGMRIRARSTWWWHYFWELCSHWLWYFLELRPSGNWFHCKLAMLCFFIFLLMCQQIKYLQIHLSNQLRAWSLEHFAIVINRMFAQVLYILWLICRWHLHEGIWRTLWREHQGENFSSKPQSGIYKFCFHNPASTPETVSFYIHVGHIPNEHDLAKDGQ